MGCVEPRWVSLFLPIKWSKINSNCGKILYRIIHLLYQLSIKCLPKVTMDKKSSFMGKSCWGVISELFLNYSIVLAFHMLNHKPDALSLLIFGNLWRSKLWMNKICYGKKYFINIELIWRTEHFIMLILAFSELVLSPINWSWKKDC